MYTKATDDIDTGDRVRMYVHFELRFNCSESEFWCLFTSSATVQVFLTKCWEVYLCIKEFTL